MLEGKETPFFIGISPGERFGYSLSSSPFLLYCTTWIEASGGGGCSGIYAAAKEEEATDGWRDTRPEAIFY